MPFFKLKSGTHQEAGAGHIYTKGEIVESKYNLVKMFGKEKFQLTDERPKHKTDDEASPMDDDYYKPGIEKGERGPTVPPESPHEEQRREERGDDIPLKPEGKKGQRASAKASKAKAKEVEAEEETENELGEDVSDQFEGAGEEYRIYKKGKNYSITDLDGEVLHDDPITTKGMVETTLEDWSEEYDV